jgi:hypothetical protein
MRIRIITGLLLIMISNSLMAQFVGDAAANTGSQAGSDTPKPAFTLKVGTALPISTYTIVPNFPVAPYTSGNMGAKPGLFVEAGFGMDIIGSDAPVGFYYYPLLMSLWQTKLDWSELGGGFSDEAIYTKPVTVLDIAQRYGIFVKPIDKLSAALYYRPGGIIPFDFEIMDSGSGFLFTGEMSVGDDAPVFMMSHTFGLSVKYDIYSISLERYSANPTYDIQYPSSGVVTTAKIPVRLFMLSFALAM